jgi:hypothetical protein
MEKADAAYENCETLVLRDVGCLIATIGGWAFQLAPIGKLGNGIVAVLELPEPKFHAMGAKRVL